jgi:S-adenosylmethionine:tRNA ribosyltransferase-isomerase
MKASDFDYHLPEKLIAQQPLPQRRQSRLLVLDARAQHVSDDEFARLEDYIQEGDLMVFNDTRVFPARLFGRKESGGKVEVLVERILDANTLLAHVRSSKSPKSGARLILEDQIHCEVSAREHDLFVLQQHGKHDWLELLQEHGHIPLPPYIQRADDAQDQERYQTVFASQAGAVAAPTAGLHFDEAMIESLQARGVNTAFLTLHVGAGTFQPLRADDVSEHVMHAEYVHVSESLCAQVEDTHSHGGRVIAVGTTVVRSLEAAAQSGRLQPFQGDTQLFITPGFEFRVVDAMLTNFHLPRSTLLMLVSAFAGRTFMLDAYRHAVEQQYRFFSYGDAMFIRNSREPEGSER